MDEKIEQGQVIDFAVQRDEHGRLKPGSKLALKHGMYSSAFTESELAERQEFEREAIQDLGGDLPAGKLALLRVVSLQYGMLRRCDRNITRGVYIPVEHVIALMNSFRLNVSALGLERQQRPALTLQEYLKQREAEKAQEKLQLPQPAEDKAKGEK